MTQRAVDNPHSSLVSKQLSNVIFFIPLPYILIGNSACHSEDGTTPARLMAGVKES